MSKFADLKGLKNFIQKVNKINVNDKAKEILNRICELGVDYAKSLYNTENIEVEYVIYCDNTATIKAKGDEIAYIEFGTGERGRGTYEGNLPTQKLRFYSNRLKRKVSLDGWVYSYANEIDYNQSFWVGFGAKAQMWKTSQFLRENIDKIIREVVG